jgi:hypothetical protein
MVVGAGCFRSSETAPLPRPSGAAALESTAAASELLTTGQMEALIAGQGCFGLGTEGCCALIIRHYSYLWSLRIADPLEMIAAYIDGRKSGRCF